MKKIRALIAQAKEELSHVGIDTTGEGAEIPHGFMRVLPELAQTYEEAGHLVETRILGVRGTDRTVVLVKLGDPEHVTRRVLSQKFFPKPNEAT